MDRKLGQGGKLEGLLQGGSRRRTEHFLPAQLLIEVSGDEPRVYDVSGEAIRIGRADDNEIHLPTPYVSRHQAVLNRTEIGYRLELPPEATTPLIYRGRQLTESLDLSSGDVFRAVGEAAGEMVTFVYALADGAPGRTEGELRLDASMSVRIGSTPDNDLGAGNPLIDAHHAEIEHVDDRLLLRDLGKGITRLNGDLVTGVAQLAAGDVVQIGSLRIEILPGRLEYYDRAGDLLSPTRRGRTVPEEVLSRTRVAGGVLVEARHLNQRIRDGVNLLDDISLRIRPSAFVVLVGLSGAGKTTLMNALAGYKPASDGEMRIDGADLYAHFDTFRTRIGYVPQRDIVHMQLTVFEALEYAAQLRMPPGTAPEARRCRVEEVMADLDLTERRDLRVSALSGGQLKRVSIGVELITSPSLLFLDEPTSGLDPGTETGLMRLMRRLADQGRTIILITHATKNVMLADNVIFMVRGGRLAWYGPPSEAMAYFDRYRTERERLDKELEFDGIYPLLENSGNGTPEQWAERYRADTAYQRYIAMPLGLVSLTPADRSEASKHSPDGSQKSDSGRPVVVSRGRGPKSARPPPAAPQISALKQLIILSARNIKLLGRDRFALLLILLAAPLLASLDFLITTHKMFDPVLGDPLRVTITISTMVVNGMLVGALAQMREIIRDKDIYRRERLVNLKIAPYVLSKVWIAALLALYQALCWVGIRYLAVQMPGSLNDALGIYVTMVLTVLIGMMLGLLASAVAPTEDSVSLLVALLIVPQVLFNGALLPVPILNPAAQALTASMPSRWSFETLITQSGMGKQLATDPAWQLSKTKRAALTNAQKRRDACLGINIFTRCTFPGIRSYETPAVWASPPPKPAALTSARSSPAHFAAVFQRYETAYVAWKERHDRPIITAEGRLEIEHDNFGPIYDVNVAGHWLVLLGFVAALTAAILGIQKAKDVV